MVLLVNDALLDDVSDDDPSLTTLADFRTTIDALSVPEGRHVLGVSSSSWTAYGWIVAHGGSLVTLGSDGTPTFTFDDPATAEALELLAMLVDQGYAPRHSAPDLAAESVQTFSAGDSVMHASGSWDLPQTWRASAASIAAGDVSVRCHRYIRTDPARSWVGPACSSPSGPLIASWPSS